MRIITLSNFCEVQNGEQKYIFLFYFVRQDLEEYALNAKMRTPYRNGKDLGSKVSIVRYGIFRDSIG